MWVLIISTKDLSETWKSQYFSRKPICQGGRKPIEVFQIIMKCWPLECMFDAVIYITCLKKYLVHIGVSILGG